MVANEILAQPGNSSKNLVTTSMVLSIQ